MCTWPVKSSARTVRASWRKSYGERISDLRNGIAPLGHSVSACSVASCWVGAHETSSWIARVRVAGSRPASRAPSSNRASSWDTRSPGAPTVMIPSAWRPTRRAATGPEAATRMGGATSGMVHRRVDSIVKWVPA